SSRGVSRVLRGTSTAPALAMAWTATTNASVLGKSTATRGPALTPAPARAPPPVPAPVPGPAPVPAPVPAPAAAPPPVPVPSPPAAPPWPGAFPAGSVPPASSTARGAAPAGRARSEEHTSELQSREKLVCRLLLEKKKTGATLNVMDNHRIYR